MIAGIGHAVLTTASSMLLLVVAANCVAALVSCLLPFGAMLPRSRRLPTATPTTRPIAASFVSVHVPTYDEPPELVIATLHRLSEMTGVAFEVIVVDNNTRDPARWQPVAAAAAALGSRFHFHHFDHVAGAKAGALNLALTLTDLRATHVAIVDADYQVTPDFLSSAVTAFAAHEVDYIQFPQAYRDVGPAARGVERELGDYFASFAGRAGRTGAMLPTGTLSVFTLEALRAVGGWSAATITEDAEIGVRLQAIGRRGLWLADERGSGLLPLDFDGLRRQRARWVAGNVQVLMNVVSDRGSGPRSAPFVRLFVQLTAWVSLWLVPAGALLLLAVLPPAPLAAVTCLIAAGTILGSAGLTGLRMYLAMPTPRHELKVWAAAATTKLALTWTAAFAWLPAVTGRTLPFERTCKEIGAVAGGRFGALFAGSLLFGAVVAIYLVRGEPVAAGACALLALVWPCSRIVDANLRRSALAAAHG